MRAASFPIVVTLSIVLTAYRAGQASEAQSAAQVNDGKREFTISGCLLRSGYAGYQIDGAKIDAVEGKPALADAVPNDAVPKKWSLQGGGNLGPRVGERVQVVGRSEWRISPSSKGAADEPPKDPELEVKSVKTIASSCS